MVILIVQHASLVIMDSIVHRHVKDAMMIFAIKPAARAVMVVKSDFTKTLMENALVVLETVQNVLRTRIALNALRVSMDLSVVHHALDV